MEYTQVKASALRFKGQKRIKKIKKGKRSRLEAEETFEEVEVKHGKWYLVDSVERFSGVVFIQNLIDGRYIYAEPDATLTTGRIYSAEDTEGPEPAEMFLIVPASDGQYAFKSGYNRYVGMNISGSLCGYAEAIGALEQWIVQCNPDKTFSFKSATNKFLCSKGNGVLTSKSAKSMDGEPSDDDPTVNLTGLLDDDSVRFKVWTDQPPLMVAKARVTHHEEDVGVLELNTSKKYQSYQGKGATPMVSKEGKKALKIAAKEGRLNEELLERRSKIKADRYCK